MEPRAVRARPQTLVLAAEHQTVHGDDQDAAARAAAQKTAGTIRQERSAALSARNDGAVQKERRKPARGLLADARAVSVHHQRVLCSAAAKAALQQRALVVGRRVVHAAYAGLTGVEGTAACSESCAARPAAARSL